MSAKLMDLIVVNLEPHFVTEIEHGVVTGTTPAHDYYLDAMLDPADPTRTLRQAQQATVRQNPFAASLRGDERGMMLSTIESLALQLDVIAAFYVTDPEVRVSSQNLAKSSLTLYTMLRNKA